MHRRPTGPAVAQERSRSSRAPGRPSGHPGCQGSHTREPPARETGRRARGRHRLAGGRAHADALAGSTLRRGEFRIPQLATVDLTGATVREVVARGKHLLIRLDDGRTLRTHFRMDGSWHIYRRGAKWHGGPAYDVRMILATDEWECVGYRLHDIDLVPTAEEDRLVGHLGPDVLGPDWDLDEALRRLRDRPDEQIGVALVDQRNLAGIGNLYKVESAVPPRRPPLDPGGRRAGPRAAGRAGTAR